MVEQSIIVPSYMVNFQCQMCTECCCGWKIIVEKTAYKELKNLFVTKRLTIGSFDEFLQREREPRLGGNIDYGILKLSDDGKCKMLDGNLCTVQKSVGPEYLPGVCKVFPRIIIWTPRGLEFSLTPGCKSAARAFLSKNRAEVLVDPPGFKFIPGSLIWDYVTRELYNKNPITRSYFLLEQHFIKILQTRSLSIEERIIFLGLTIKQITELPQGISFNGELENLVKANHEDLAEVSFAQNVRKMGINMEYQILALRSFLNLNLYKTSHDPEVADTIAKCAGLLVSGEMKGNVTTYRKMYHYHMRPVAGDVSHVFENYLVNYVLSKKFILYPLEDAFYILAFLYVIIRAVTFYLAFAKEQAVTEEDVVKAIYLIEKSLGHTKAYDQVLELLKKQDKTDIKHAIGLVRI